ncbi:MAG TPA: putative quinol monooxygenase [Propionibacteriaceae bacterium]|nr:putative quinol monooxygenase [Propionibacteriaceae bacterium]
MPNSLLIVHVDVAVVPDQLEGFLAATEENATASREEPGVVRFDVLSDRTDPNHVVLAEIYRNEAAAAAHKETPHYSRWRDAVEPMMARPRQSVRYVNTSPGDEGW